MEEEINETQSRVYELGFLLTPNIADTDIEEHTARLQKAIETVGGTVLSSGSPEYIDLAYQMEQRVGGKINKWTQGFFGWLKFELDPAQTEALKKALDLDQSLIRYLFIKTDIENTVIFKKPKIEAKRAVEGADDEAIDEAALEAETVALEASGELDTPVESEAESDLSEHEKLPDVTNDIERETE